MSSLIRCTIFSLNKFYLEQNFYFKTTRVCSSVCLSVFNLFSLANLTIDNLTTIDVFFSCEMVRFALSGNPSESR